MQGNSEANTSTSGHSNKPKVETQSPLLALIHDPQRAVLIKQGAEAKVYKITNLFTASPSSTSPPYSSPPFLLKHRFPKTYRHRVLDAQLTKSRISHEAKCLAKCKKAGVDVPAIRAVDVQSGILLLEWIDGPGSVREVLGGLPEDGDDIDHHDGDDDVYDADLGDGIDELSQRLTRLGLSKYAIMESIGKAIGRMHRENVIHGDLTTSNMLLRWHLADTDDKASIVIIDFGLSYVSALAEDKAVDLYVLERALASTHPEPDDTPKPQRNIERILESYAAEIGANDWERVERRLKDVRLRGRKRSMVG